MTRPASTAPQEFERLRALLVGAESDELARLSEKVEGIDRYVGKASQLETATAEIIAKALRRAEVERHRELSNAIAPLVVSVIRSEIKNSKEAMIEALYPITGRLVRAAVANAFRELLARLNERLDKLTSADGLKLRARALLTGKSVSELALAEAHRARITRMLFLERGSGTLIAAWQMDGNAPDQPELVSGLIAAITEFASSALGKQGGELRTLDLGASRVILRASARMIIAADCEGALRPQEEAALDTAFLNLLERYDRGEPANAAMLAEVAASVALPAQQAAKSPGKALYVLAALLLGALLWWGGGRYLAARQDSQLRAAFGATVAGDAELAAYPLELVIDRAGKQVLVKGLTPDTARTDALVASLREAAAPLAVAAQVVKVAPFVETGEAAARRETREGIAALSADVAALRERAAEALSETTENLALRDALEALTAAEVKGRFEALAAGSARLSAELGEAAAATDRLRRETESIAPQLREIRTAVESETGQIKSGMDERDARAAAVEAKIAGLRTAAETLQTQIDGAASVRQAADASAAAERQRLDAVAKLLGEGQSRLDGIAGLVTGQAVKLSGADARLTASDAQAKALHARLGELEKQIAALTPGALSPEARMQALLAKSTIYFARETALDNEPRANEMLDELAALAKETGLALRVVGHTDDTGGVLANLQIALRRATLIAQMLGARGLGEKQMIVVSRGSAEMLPDAPGGSRNLNRRVTFEIATEAEGK